MKKRILIAILTILIIAASLSISAILKPSKQISSAFQEIIENSGEDIDIYDINKAASYFFPVARYETEIDGRWMIANRKGEEIFFITLQSSKDAVSVYEKSIDTYNTNENNHFLAVCGNDILYYMGIDSDTIQYIETICNRQ